MAYFIFNNNDMYKIASSEDKPYLNIEDRFYTIKTVSDSDFNNVRQNKKEAKLSGDTIVYQDENRHFETEENLKHYIGQVIFNIECFLQSNKDHAKYNNFETYRDFLQSFDTSSITYPLNKSWEEYCEDNSITYYNTLQIP